MNEPALRDRTRTPSPLPASVRHFVDSAAWIFAKTYAATWPHEYIVRKPENAEMLLSLARHIFERGAALDRAAMKAVSRAP